MTYQNITTAVEDQVGIVTLNRPKVLNALNHELMAELVKALEAFDRDDAIRVIVLTGGERAFAAGADIKEMSDETTVSIMDKDQFSTWDRIKNVRKPIIAAVKIKKKA
ncbi:MAG: enoyl-CoA hydratase/isomerase family protein [Candidatus Melainabacteria bacterium]|nr:enoyl-CoA hydratase/isomerase family protein [Candidatus Melainabacteria bacterium]